ncbi:hypothetical protein M0802_012904 [Mischocyttarus mexicanus]|nr:hypothetical protein M0802_012904 [Mischocyttarus mexicanus]
MAHQGMVYFSSVHCIRDRDNSLVKMNMYEVKGTGEKHISSVEPCQTIRGMKRGIKFLGDGRYANIPDTRLRVKVDALFEGKFVGFVNQSVESSIRPGRYESTENKNDNKENRVYIYAVPTFGSSEMSTFGNLQLVKSNQSRKSSEDFSVPDMTDKDDKPTRGRKRQTRQKRKSSNVRRENEIVTEAVVEIHPTPLTSRDRMSVESMSTGSVTASVFDFAKEDETGDSSEEAYTVLDRVKHLKNPIWNIVS